MCGLPSCNGEYGMVIQGSLEVLRTFRSCFVRHLKRDYNRAAHELAQFAKVAGSSQQWRGVEPPMLRLIGATVIALGFYAVIWGQAQEEKTIENGGICSFESSSAKVPLLENKGLDI
ncbi:hypothetical protein RGQ29_010056 [Quercus rubra]|uniref:RNase H type-1 domain-containing protein n=1 Tax=Quercus rubra TaxID=3512 RepID=A0AAN7J5P7_QUERU|nr:hypothetical protein RGQ29_010056 [Quercus rubra]